MVNKIRLFCVLLGLTLWNPKLQENLACKPKDCAFILYTVTLEISTVRKSPSLPKTPPK